MKKETLKKSDVAKFGSIAKTEPGHVDLTRDITIMCLERCLMRIKAQIKHLEKADLIYLNQIKGCKREFATIKKAIRVVKSSFG